MAHAYVSLGDEIREVFCPSPPASTRAAVINLGLSPYSVQVAKLNVIYTRLSTWPRLKGLLMTTHRRHHHFCRNPDLAGASATSFGAYKSAHATSSSSTSPHRNKPPLSRKTICPGSIHLQLQPTPTQRVCVFCGPERVVLAKYGTAR